MKHLILLFLTMTLTGCGLETIASMPIEPENTAESSPEAEERPLAPVDEIMATKGIEELVEAVEETENEPEQDEPEVVTAEEAAVEETIETPDDVPSEPDPSEGGDGEAEEADSGELEESSDPVAESMNAEPPTSYYGTCRITFYCGCSQCCGAYAGGPTASGAMPTAGWTVANGSLPFGTQVVIDGHTYCVEDRGVSGDQFDIYVDSHDEALQRGLYYADVYLAG